jgi:cell wall-associated NlpC family hydrolase
MATALLCAGWGFGHAAPDSTTTSAAEASAHATSEGGPLNAPQPAQSGNTGPAQPGGAAPFVQQVRDRASDLVMSAMNFLGVPYRRGGSSEAGFDCSGFTRHIFEMSVGLVLPRRAAEQAKAPGLLAVPKDELKPGDLVFFKTVRRAISHVGIYVGEGKFIHAPRPGGEVRVEDLRAAYWAKRFSGARRAELDTTASAAASVAAQPAQGDDASLIPSVH